MPEQWPAFPLYLMSVDGKKKFCSLQEAGVLLDSGWQRVDTAGLVLLADRSVRPMTEEEEHRISQIADEHSESK